MFWYKNGVGLKEMKIGEWWEDSHTLETRRKIFTWKDSQHCCYFQHNAFALVVQLSRWRWTFRPRFAIHMQKSPGTYSERLRFAVVSENKSENLISKTVDVPPVSCAEILTHDVAHEQNPIYLVLHNAGWCLWPHRSALYLFCALLPDHVIMKA